MKILIACEFSGTVRKEFEALGHEAWSCDLLPSEIPGNHYQGDVRDMLSEHWDLMVAHPPCTHLAVSGARWFKEKQTEQAVRRQRSKKMEMTKDVILARQLRLATISNLVGQGILDEPSAKELLAGALEPGNDSTIVDDSALLGDPEAIVKIAAEQSVQPTGGRLCENGHLNPPIADLPFCLTCKAPIG